MIARSVLLLIRLYQVLLSPLLGPVCRFEPSCSRYTATCVERFGAFRGLLLGMRRIVRCHPLSAGGYDPPPMPPRDVPCMDASHGHASCPGRHGR